MTSDAFAAEYAAARRAVGFVARTDRAWIVVSGKDRATYLHGLLTNDIATLHPGEGCYAAYLTPQGRMVADLWVYEFGDVILLSMCRDVRSTILARLDQFIFSEDVQLGDVTDNFRSVVLIGPKAAEASAEALGVSAATLSGMREHANLRISLHDHAVVVLRVTDLGEPGYELLVESSGFDTVKDVLQQQRIVEIRPEVAETLRMEAGIPKFHQDMNEETIPLEAGIESRAISFSKGCYVGQEVIIRVLHRGHGRVARRLVGILLTGDVVAPQTPIEAGGQSVGEVTSAAWSPALARPIALGYVHRDFTAPGTPLTVNGQPAEVAALPFVTPEHG